MKVQDIMTRDVETCTPSTTLTQVVKLMQDACCGIIPVVEAGRLRGVVTDRDVSLALIKSGRKPINIAVHEVMTTPVQACAPADDVRTALSAMTRFKIRRLPVVAADGSVRGILSMDDVILRALSSDAPTTTEIIASLREIVKRDEELVLA